MSQPKTSTFQALKPFATRESVRTLTILNFNFEEHNYGIKNEKKKSPNFEVSEVRYKLGFLILTVPAPPKNVNVLGFKNSKAIREPLVMVIYYCERELRK